MRPKKCYFVIDGAGQCSILNDVRCTGYNPRCSFRKTKDEYNSEKDRAIDLCREKGLCENCKYMPDTKRCLKSTET